MNILSKLVGKYKAIPIQAKASFWFLFASVVQKGIAFITTPVFTRLLSKGEYGTFSLFQTWFSIIFIFTSLNLSGAVFNNGMVKYESKRNEFVSALLGLSLFLTSIFFIIFVIFPSFWINLIGLPYKLIMLMFIQLFFEPAYLLWIARKRYEYTYRGIVISSLFIGVVNPIIGILAVYVASEKLEARIFSYVVVMAIVYIVAFISIFNKEKKIINKEYWSYALKFNIPLIPHYLSLIILNHSDRIMIQKFCGADDVALYSIAYSVSMIINVITSAINNTFIPYIYQSIKANELMKLRKRANVLILLIGIICFVPILLGPELVFVMGDKAYYNSIWAIPPICISVFFVFLYNLYGTVEFYFEKNKFVMVASTLGAVLNVLLNKMFIPKFGFWAAGYTTLVCYVIFYLAHYMFYRRLIKENSIDDVFDSSFIKKMCVLLLCLTIISVLSYKYTFLRIILVLILFIGILLFRKKIFTNIIDIVKK